MDVISCANDATVTVNPPASITTPVYKDVGASNALFVFSAFTSNSARCPIYQYDSSSTAPTTLTSLATVASPITFTATDVTVKPADPNLHQHIQFYIRASAYFNSADGETEGKTNWYTTLLDFYIGCGASWVSINAPTLSSGLIFYLNDVANNKYTFPAFTITAPASVTYCTIIDYNIVPDAGSTGTISRDITCTAGSPCTTQNFIVDLTDKRRIVDSDPILFNIIATATGGIQLTSS